MCAITKTRVGDLRSTCVPPLDQRNFSRRLGVYIRVTRWSLARDGVCRRTHCGPFNSGYAMLRAWQPSRTAPVSAAKVLAPSVEGEGPEIQGMVLMLLAGNLAPERLRGRPMCNRLSNCVGVRVLIDKPPGGVDVRQFCRSTSRFQWSATDGFALLRGCVGRCARHAGPPVVQPARRYSPWRSAYGSHAGLIHVDPPPRTVVLSVLWNGTGMPMGRIEARAAVFSRQCQNPSPLQTDKCCAVVDRTGRLLPFNFLPLRWPDRTFVGPAKERRSGFTGRS